MKFSWNDAEDAALQGLPLEAQVLYLRGLRRYMDYATGIVGRSRRISWKMLQEVLEVEPHQGLERSGQPSTSKVRRLMQWLIKAGLVEDIGTKKRGEAIFFRLPLADTDQSVSKKPGKNPANFPGKEADTIEASNHADYTQKPDKEAGMQNRRNLQKPDTHPVSGIKNPPTGGLSIGQSTEQKTRKSATRFDEFWEAYPKKVAKKACRDKWRSKGLDRIADRLIADVQRRCLEHRPWLEGYVPNPLTYLNQERWDDEIDNSGKTKRPQATVTAIDDFLYGRQVGPSTGGNVIEGQAKTINPSEDDDDDYHHSGRYGRKEAPIR